MKRTKKFLALTLLLSALITVGCGSGGEQETAAETPETDASETIGAGTGENTELDVPEADSDTETGKETETTDFSFIDEWITSIEDNKTELTLIIAHHIKEAKSVEFTYQDVLLDGAAAVNWEAHGLGADTFTIDPNAFQSFPQTLVLGTNIDDYSELTVHAVANFDDGTEPYPFSATFQINEMERNIEEKAPASAEIYIEEQELYNANGIVITLPEQKLDPSKEPQIHFENNTEVTIYLSYMNLTVDGELIREGAHNTADGGGNAGVSADEEIPVGESLQTAVDSGRDSGEITFVLFITENQYDPIAEPEITIPYTVITE